MYELDFFLPVQPSNECLSYSKDKPLNKINYLVIDVQTTGASPRNAHLLECAYQVFHLLDKTSSRHAEDLNAQLSTQVKACLVELPPGVRLNKVISKLTGIKIKDLQKAKKPDILAQELWMVIECIHQEIQREQAWVCLAHVARYERSFIRALCLAHPPKDLNHVEAQARFDSLPWLCTHAISTRLYPSLPRRSLNAMNAYFGGTEIKLKRATSHLKASLLIWRSIHAVLETKQIKTWGSLSELLSQSAKRGRFKPSLPAQLRLEAPSLPGVYNFYDQRSTVVYVGRARNLNQRVNQHFRGQKGHDERHLELLGVTHHVDWQTCPSVLEAKHLENKKIKELTPRYNKALSKQKTPFYFKADDLSIIDDLSVHESLIEALTTFRNIGPWIDERLIERLQDFMALLAGDFSSIHRSYWPNQALDTWQVARKLIIGKLEQVNEQVLDIFLKCQTNRSTQVYGCLTWGYTIEQRELSCSKEPTKQMDHAGSLRNSTVNIPGEKVILNSCELLMLQLWQTWQATQWQSLLQQGEIIWLADTGKSQKTWRQLSLDHMTGSQYLSQEPQVQNSLESVQDLMNLSPASLCIDRLTYDQSRLTYLSLLSLAREGIASYYRRSSQDSWVRLELLPKPLNEKKLVKT